MIEKAARYCGAKRRRRCCALGASSKRQSSSRGALDQIALPATPARVASRSTSGRAQDRHSCTIKGYAAPEIEAAVARARLRSNASAWRAARPMLYFGRSAGFGSAQHRSGQQAILRELDRSNCLPLARAARRRGPSSDGASLSMGRRCFTAEATCRESRDHYERAHRALRCQPSIAHLADAFGGHDPGVCALGCHRASGLRYAAIPDQARRDAGAGALALPRSSPTRRALRLAHSMRWFTFMILRDRHDGERTGANAVGGACGEVRPSVLPLARPLWHGLGEGARADACRKVSL